MAEWFVVRKGKEHGPFQDAQLKSLATSGKLKEEDQVRRSDHTITVAAKSIGGLFGPALSLESPVFGIPPVLTDDSELLLPERASDLATHNGQLILSGLEILEPEIAQILVKHRGGTLSLPAIRQISAEVAGILAQYEGALRLDGVVALTEDEASRLAEHKGEVTLRGLWMLTSIPLAKKLAGLWKTEGKGSQYPNLSITVAEALRLGAILAAPCPAYPNLSITVAEALDLWPPASANFPPYRIKGLVTGTIGLYKEWQRYYHRRAEMLILALAELRAEHALAADGLDKRRSDDMPARIAEVEQRFGISLASTFPYTSDQLFDYVGSGGDCFGPVSSDQMGEVIGALGADWCFYWPCGDPDDDYDASDKGPTNPIGPALIEDIRLAVGVRSQIPFLEQMSLLLLHGVWQYQKWFGHEVRNLFNESTRDFAGICEQAEMMEQITEVALSFTPQLRKIPWKFTVRHILFWQLSEFAQYAENRLSLDESQWQMLEVAIARMRPPEGTHSSQ